MRTIRGIYLDINESDYYFKIYDFTFYFSSKSYLEKFEKGYYDYIRYNTLKLSSELKVKIYASDILLINYYKSIEKRGFRVLYNNERIEEPLGIELKLI